MIIIGTFEHSLDLELLLDSVENNNVDRKHIMIIQMEIDSNNPFQFDNKKQELSYKAIEVGIACATGCTVIGTSVGFVLQLGPVIWGLTAALIGFFIGFGFIYFTKKIGTIKNQPNKFPEVIVIVQCQEEQKLFIINEMWKYKALTVGKTT